METRYLNFLIVIFGKKIRVEARWASAMSMDRCLACRHVGQAALETMEIGDRRPVLVTDHSLGSRLQLKQGQQLK